MWSVQKGSLLATARQEVDYRVRRPDVAVPVGQNKSIHATEKAIEVSSFLLSGLAVTISW